MAAYALCIFLSAFLLFQVQPLLGHYILPWFGGSPAVWTACLMFFQVGLLGGYFYAHKVVSRLNPRLQGRLHLTLLALSLATLPVTPNPAWRTLASPNPTWDILLLLARTVGAPYVLISATGPLLQGWFAKSFPGRSPYRLYALSNAGSLLALLSYPVLVEPALRLKAQTNAWSLGYALFAALCGMLAWQLNRLGTAAGAQQPAAEQPTDAGDESRPPSLGLVLLWLGLAMCGTLMLLATTNQLCQDVAVVPFLWVLPLSLYLLSFIICFDRERWYVRPVYGVLLVVSAWVDYKLINKGLEVPLLKQILGYSLALFVATMACHGELVRLKPQPRHLTLFYLMVSLGGALSGIFVALAAPRLFTGYYELHVGLALTLALFVVVTWRDLLLRYLRGDLPQARAAAGLACELGLCCFTLLLGARLVGEARSDKAGTIENQRNFYGVLRVFESDEDKPDWHMRMMRHGRIVHGYQFQSDEKRAMRTTYFSAHSGLGLSIDRNPTKPRKVGVIGLGTGSIEAWAERGDSYRVYEINDGVIDLCERYFTYIQDARGRGADVKVLLGDGRLVLEKEALDGQLQQFDTLVVDAFSSDAIPVHLMTKECFELYWKHLKPDGVLALHISNRYIDLKPVVRALGDAFGKTTLWIHHDPGENNDRMIASDWLLMTSNPQFLADPAVTSRVSPWTDNRKILWTDDFTNLYQVLRLKVR